MKQCINLVNQNFFQLLQGNRKPNKIAFPEKANKSNPKSTFSKNKKNPIYIPIVSPREIRSDPQKNWVRVTQEQAMSDK